jgi:plastocyanin
VLRASSITVIVGTVEFTMTNEGAAEHDLVIEELGDLEVIGLIGGGETGSGSVALDAGTCCCSGPGHREAGMEGTLTVTDWPRSRAR